MVGCFQLRQVGAEVRRAEVLVSGQEGCHDLLVFHGRDRAGRVHQGTAGLQSPRLRPRGCGVAAPASASGRPALRQRASGREASVPRSLQGGSTRRGRRSLDALRGVLGAHVDDRRAHPLAPCGGKASARPGCFSTATISPTSPISAARCVVLPPGAAHRSSTRSPCRGASARATAIAARDCGISSSHPSHSGARRCQTARRGSAPRGRRCARAASRRARWPSS